MVGVDLGIEVGVDFVGDLGVVGSVVFGCCYHPIGCYGVVVGVPFGRFQWNGYGLNVGLMG